MIVLWQRFLPWRGDAVFFFRMMVWLAHGFLFSCWFFPRLWHLFFARVFWILPGKRKHACPYARWCFYAPIRKCLVLELYIMQLSWLYAGFYTRHNLRRVYSVFSQGKKRRNKKIRPNSLFCLHICRYLRGVVYAGGTRRHWKCRGTENAGNGFYTTLLAYALSANYIVSFFSYSFRSLASKGFPSGYSKKCVCASACTQKAPNLRCCFLKRRLMNTPRRHRLADRQLSSRYPPSPSFSSFGSASVMLCYSPPASSSTPSRPSVYYPISISLS